MPQRCFALIPAAGIGLRAGSGSPKQYASLNGEAMLAHTIRAFARAPEIELVAVVLAPGDAWPACAAGRAITDEFPGRLRFFGVGGETRAASVLNGLDALADTARADDWMLVHDAARPCITPRMIADLVAALRDDPVGGLLALPVPDTVKRADAAGRVAASSSSAAIWAASGPPTFRRTRPRSVLWVIPTPASLMATGYPSSSAARTASVEVPTTRSGTNGTPNSASSCFDASSERACATARSDRKSVV